MEAYKLVTVTCGRCIWNTFVRLYIYLFFICVFFQSVKIFDRRDIQTLNGSNSNDSYIPSRYRDVFNIAIVYLLGAGIMAGTKKKSGVWEWKKKVWNYMNRIKINFNFCNKFLKMASYFFLQLIFLSIIYSVEYLNHIPQATLLQCTQEVFCTRVLHDVVIVWKKHWFVSKLKSMAWHVALTAHIFWQVTILPKLAWKVWNGSITWIKMMWK